VYYNMSLVVGGAVYPAQLKIRSNEMNVLRWNKETCRTLDKMH
jgi:hypothetical protein